MMQKEYLLVGVALFGLWCIMSKEKYEEPMDISSLVFDNGYDTTSMKEISVAVTSDLMQHLIFLVENHIKTTTGLCVYAINVPYVRVIGDDEGNMGYNVKIMYMATQGFPYGFEVDALVVNDQVVKVSSQTSNGMSADIKPYVDEVAHVFVPFEKIEALVKPEPNALPAEFGIAKHTLKDNHYKY